MLAHHQQHHADHERQEHALGVREHEAQPGRPEVGQHHDAVGDGHRTGTGCRDLPQQVPRDQRAQVREHHQGDVGSAAEHPTRRPTEQRVQREEPHDLPGLTGIAVLGDGPVDVAVPGEQALIEVRPSVGQPHVSAQQVGHQE